MPTKPSDQKFVRTTVRLFKEDVEKLKELAAADLVNWHTKLRHILRWALSQRGIDRTVR